MSHTTGFILESVVLIANMGTSRVHAVAGDGKGDYEQKTLDINR